MNDLVFDINSRNKFSISASILINVSAEKLWAIITAPGNLENTHPFCKSHSKDLFTGVGSKDKTVFNSGKIFDREVINWNPQKGFTVKMINDQGKNTEIGFEISKGDTVNNCKYKVTITTDGYKKSPRPFWPLFSRWVLIPSFKRYLYSLLNGVKYYSETGIKVKKNQFGSHKRYSP